MTRRPAGSVLLAALLAGVACRGAGERGVSAGAAANMIHLAVLDGPNAGSYEVASDEVLCSRNLTGPGIWGVQYTRGSFGAGLGSLQLVVADSAGWGESGELHLGLVFGSFADGVDHEIETRPGAPRPAGRGAARIRDSAGVGLFDVAGRTADSVALEATIRCNRVRNGR